MKSWAASIKEIGDIGERLVQSSLQRYHKNVVLSENKFDSKKDMIADGETVEVKTLVKIKIYSAFCVGSSQIDKCMEVDRLFFVHIARHDSVDIYEALKPRRTFNEWFNQDDCYFFRLTDLKLYDKVQDKIAAARLRALTPSNYL
jgi:CCR4-NOT transcriptional regulation complex NOT5 subunit